MTNRNFWRLKITQPITTLEKIILTEKDAFAYLVDDKIADTIQMLPSCVILDRSCTPLSTNAKFVQYDFFLVNQIHTQNHVNIHVFEINVEKSRHFHWDEFQKEAIFHHVVSSHPENWNMES